MHDTEPDTHTLIHPPRLSPEQVAAMQPHTVREALAEATAIAFHHLTITRHRDQHQFALNIEHLGGCTRQAAYRVAAIQPDTAPHQSSQDRVTNLDHITTAALLPALSYALGAQHQVPVTLTAENMTLPGTIPLYWPTAAVLATLFTTPTITQHVTGLSKHLTPPMPDQRLTMLALAVAALQQRMPVAWLGYLRTSRGTGEGNVAVEAMTDEHEQLVYRRVHEIVQHADDPDSAPAEPRELEPPSFVPNACGRCPWFARCAPNIGWQRPDRATRRTP